MPSGLNSVNTAPSIVARRVPVNVPGPQPEQENVIVSVRVAVDVTEKGPVMVVLPPWETVSANVPSVPIAVALAPEKIPFPSGQISGATVVADCTKTFAVVLEVSLVFPQPG